VIDHVNNLKLQHLVELSKLGDGCSDLEREIEGWLAEHDVVFAGTTIPFVLMPHFVSPGQVRRIRHAVACLSDVLNRFCDAYPDEPALQEELALSAHEDALVRLDPGFPHPVRICRLDAFLQGYDVKFLEFNADSPAGIGYTDILYEGLRRGSTFPACARSSTPPTRRCCPSCWRPCSMPTSTCAPAAPTFPSTPGWASSTPPARPRCPSSGSPARRPASTAWRHRSARSTT
jgi:hypothetical protein